MNSRFRRCVFDGCTQDRVNWGMPGGQGIYCVRHYLELVIAKEETCDDPACPECERGAGAE